MKTQAIKKRNIGIDILRALSTLYIVGFWHLFTYTTAFPQHNNAITYKLTLVILGTFVLISGHFIGEKDLQMTKNDIAKFFQRRLLRIYPLYILALGLFTTMKISNLTISLKAALLISMFVKPAPLTLWFITMLLLFYFISPLFIHASKTLQTQRFIGYYIIAVLLLITYSVFTKMLDTRLLLYSPAFILGIRIAKNDINISIGKYKIYYLAALIISFLLSFVTTPYEELNAIINAPMVLLFSHLFFNVAKRLIIRSEQVRKTISFLSYSSYAMYLFHRPIYDIAKRIYFPETPAAQAVYLLVFCLPLITLCSFMIQKFYDIALDKLNRTFRKEAAITA